MSADNMKYNAMLRGRCPNVLVAGLLVVVVFVCLNYWLLLQEVSLMNKQITGCKDDILTYNEKHDELNDQHHRLTDTNQENIVRLSRLNEELKTAKDSIRVLELKISKFELEKIADNEKYTLAVEEQKTCSASLVKTQSKLTDLEKKSTALSELTSQVDKLKLEKTKLSNKLESCKQQIGSELAGKLDENEKSASNDGQKASIQEESEVEQIASDNVEEREGVGLQAPAVPQDVNPQRNDVKEDFQVPPVPDVIQANENEINENGNAVDPVV